MPLVDSEVVDAVATMAIGAAASSPSLKKGLDAMMVPAKSSAAEATDQAKEATTKNQQQQHLLQASSNQQPMQLKQQQQQQQSPEQQPCFAPCRSSNSCSSEDSACSEDSELSLYGEEGEDEEEIAPYPIRVVAEPTKSMRMLKNVLAKTLLVVSESVVKRSE